MQKPIREKDLRPMAPKPAAPSYVHLKVHSAYSLLEGALQIPKIAKLAIAHGMPAVGLTDTNNMFGALEFSDKLAEAGLQPIVGCTLQTDFARERRQARRPICARARTSRRPSSPAPLRPSPAPSRATPT